MRYFDRDEIARHLDYRELADALHSIFAQSEVQVPQRLHFRTGSSASRSTLLVMPAWQNQGLLIVKLVTVTPGNPARGLPTVQGILQVVEQATGALLATVDATELTRRRTAATSLLAARFLARAASETLLIVGAGAMASHLLHAYCAEFSLRKVWIWNRTRHRADALAAAASTLGIRVETTEALDEAVADADIVSCATLSDRALVCGKWVRPGTHIDLVGAFTPAMRECDDELLRRANVFVDTRQGAFTEAGDLLQAIASGAISASHVRGELADLVTGRGPGRESDGAITVFKSVGSAIEDLAACSLLLRRAGGA